MFVFMFVPIIIFVIAFIFIIVTAMKGFNRHSKVEKSILNSIENVVNNSQNEQKKQVSYCEYCGSEINEDETKCSSCGAKKKK